MLLPINDYETVGDIQERFNKSFPYLKLEFYQKPHPHKAASLEKYLISSDKRVGEIRKLHRNSELQIMSWYSIAKVKADFKKLFELNIEIFRKEINGWVQITRTDKYTLHDQEDFARHSSTSIHPKVPEQLGEYEYL
ncbi:MAG: hypothetical protein ACJ749_00735 [Flavisolibacter sp.]